MVTPAADVVLLGYVVTHQESDMMTGSWLSKRGEIEQSIEDILRETNKDRALDSVEMIIVETVLVAHGIAIPEGSIPPSNTIKGWLEWAERSSSAQ
jgi:hypothetical protein